MNDVSFNLKDIEEKVEKKNKYLTDFLTPLEARKIEEYFECKKLKEKYSLIKYEYDPNILTHERTKIYIVNNDILFDTINYENYNETFKIDIIKIEPNKFSRKLVHKDYLGTILGLGIKREKVGDIIVTNDNNAYTFISSDILEYVLENLKKIGHETVKVSLCKTINKEKLVDDYIEKNITLTSFRADNLISHAFGISRQLSSELFEKEFVKINFETSLNKLYEIKQDDLISVRGYGRVKIVMLDGDNKKGRHRIKINIYTKDNKR